MYGSPYFDVNNAMSVNAAKYGGGNAMIAPGSYGGDPYSMMGGGYMGPSAPVSPSIQQGYNFARSSEGMAPVAPMAGGPLSIQDFRASMLGVMPQQPANPYQGMTPFGNHYTRYLMGGGQRLNRLARPIRGDVAYPGMGGKFGQQAPGGYRLAGAGLASPYDYVG